MADFDTATTRANVLSDIENYIQPQAILWMENQLCADVAADKGNRVPTKKGDTIEFCRILEQAKDTTELTAGSQPAPVSMFTMDITATAKEYGGRIELERRPMLTASHISLLDQGSKLLGKKMADTADYLITSMIATNAYRIRADQDSTYQVNVTTTSDGNAGMTTLISTSLTQAESFWVGARCTITGVDTAKLSREAIYQTRKVSAFATATGTVTVDTAYDAIIKSGCTVHLAIGTGIVSTDTLTTDVFADTITRLTLNKATRFSGKPGQNLPKQGEKAAGYFQVIVDPLAFLGFISDTTWVNTGINQVAENLINGGSGKWMATQINGTTQPWREDVDGTENEAAGAVHAVNFLGEHAYGISDIAAPGAKPPYGLVVTYLDSKGLGQTVPRYDEIGAILYFCKVPLNDLFNVCVLCGAKEIA